MTDADPACHLQDCDAPNHCIVHCVHHCVDSMARWCKERYERGEARG